MSLFLKVQEIYGIGLQSKVSSAFQTFKDFFVATGEFLIGGFNSISDWISDKLAAPFKFLTDLFSFSEEDATAGGIATKLIDLIALPFNLAVNFIKGLFGFGADEKGEVEPFSLGEFVVGVVGDVIDYIKSFLVLRVVFSIILNYLTLVICS